MSDAHEPAPPGKLVLFRGADAPSMEDAGLVTERSFAGGSSLEELFDADDSEGAAQSFTSVPFRHADPDGFSLSVVEFPPGFLLPRHSHSADCLYYITRGSIEMGARTLAEGDGFFVPAEQPYAYRTGAGGVTLLEFRNRTDFDTKFHEPDAERFKAKAQASLAEAAKGQRGIQGR